MFGEYLWNIYIFYITLFSTLFVLKKKDFCPIEISHIQDFVDYIPMVPFNKFLL